MFSAVEMILTKVSKNREKNRRQADEGADGAKASDTGTARRRRRHEERKRSSSGEESSGDENNSVDNSSEESHSSEENSDSSSRVRKRKELERKKKSERKKSTASSKSRTSKSGRDRKMSGTIDRSSRHDAGTIDRSSRHDEGLKQEPETRMSRRYKSEELLNASDEESPKLTQSSRAISSLSLKEDQDRKVKQKQIFMELRRKQEKERKDQLAEQRRLKQQKEQQEIMDTISQARSTEERRLKQVSEINQTQSHSISQQFVQSVPPSNSNKLQEKQWKETSLDSDGSEGHGKKRVPIVPPKPRKKPNDNQSSDSLNEFSSRENIVDNIGSLQRSNEVIQRPLQSSGTFQTSPNKNIQNRLQTDQPGFSNTASKSGKLSTAVGYGTGKESSTGAPFSQTRGGYYSSSMPRTQHKGQSLMFPRPYKPPQNSLGSSTTARNTVNMGYQGDQVKRNSGVVYQVPNHGPAVFPYNGALRGSPTPSNQTIGDFRRNEVSRTINYGHLAQQRSDLV